MKKSIMLTAAAVTLAGCLASGDQLLLAEAGKSKYTIIYEFKGDVLLDPAVRDLADTLKGHTMVALEGFSTPTSAGGFSTGAPPQATIRRN